MRNPARVCQWSKHSAAILNMVHLYLPECVEGVFSEVHLQNRAEAPVLRPIRPL
jgi:hypothetical protein